MKMQKWLSKSESFKKMILVLTLVSLMTLNGCTVKQSAPLTQSTVVEQYKPAILPAQMCLLPTDVMESYGDYPEIFLPQILNHLAVVNDHNRSINRLNGAVEE